MGGVATRVRIPAAFVTLLLLVAVAGVANLCAGSVALHPAELARTLAEGAGSGTAAQVVWGIRLPRLLAAGILGGALALAGVLLQTFFANPIAGPYILGISSGAKLAVAVLMIFVVGNYGVVTSWMSVVAATLGALGVTLAVLVASRRIRTASGLVVAGVMVGYVCNAATDFVATFAGDASVASLRNWSLGSFSGTNWDDVRTMAAIVAVAATCVFLLSKPLGAYQMGEGYAQSVGVNVGAFRVAVIVLSSVLSACVTAFAGPISFVGIAVPHMVKRLLGTSRPLVVVPAAFLGGSAFCLVSDLVARTLFAPAELAVSTVTAALGAPVVMGMLWGRARRRGTIAKGYAHEAPTSAGKAPLGTGARAAQASGGIVVRAQGLAAGYDGEALLRDVDVGVAAGQVATLVGPNGAGKSTLLKALAGQLPALAGEVRLCGSALGELSERERARLRAVLLTERLQTELLTCEDVVGMGRYPFTGHLGVLSPADREKVAQAMELLEVRGLAQADFMQLSDGQRQRVLLARALCQEPQVLLLDEPTSYLDIRYQVELLRLLRRLAHERGLAVVMTLHELSLARQASDWLVFLRKGRVARQGVPEEVFTTETVEELFDLEEGMFDLVAGVVVGDATHDAGTPRGSGEGCA